MNSLLTRYDNVLSSVFQDFESFIDKALVGLSNAPEPIVMGIENNGVEINLPNFGEKHVKVDVKDGVLTIKATKNTRGKVTGNKKSQVFLYSSTVGDVELKNKTFENGVLKVELQKKGG